MPSTPTRFVGGVLIPNTAVVQLTVPAGHRYLIRDVAMVNSTAATAMLPALLLNGSGTSNRLWRNTIPADTSVMLAPWWVLEAGDELWAGKAATGTVSLFVSGYDLT